MTSSEGSLGSRMNHRGRPYGGVNLILKERFARSIHANPRREIWPVIIGIGVASVGAHYVARALQNIERKRKGNTEDNEDSNNGSSTHMLGVDLGLSTMSMASLDRSITNSLPKMIVNDHGDRTSMPAAITLLSGEPTVGNVSRMQPLSTVFGLPYLLGRKVTDEDMKEFISKLPFKVSSDAQGMSSLCMEDNTYSVEWGLEMLLSHLGNLAENHTGSSRNQTVLAVPTSYSPLQRQKMEKAAIHAGMNVVELLEESTAAILAAEQDSSTFRSDGLCAVFDIGGLGSSFTLVKNTSNKKEIICSRFSSQLSGKVIDNILTSWLCDTFQEQHGIDLRNDPMSLARVLDSAEKLKIELSSQLSADINIPYITADQNGPKHLISTIRRSQLNHLMQSTFDLSATLCTQVCQESQISPQDIDELLIVGGCARIPQLLNTVCGHIGKTSYHFKHYSPEEVVAIGACLRASQLGGEY